MFHLHSHHVTPFWLVAEGKNKGIKGRCLLKGGERGVLHHMVTTCCRRLETRRQHRLPHPHSALQR